VNTKDVAAIVNDEAAGFAYIEDLHDLDLLAARANVTVATPSKALRRAVEIVQTILFDLDKSGIDLGDADPGHAIGHMGRDYAHALQLLVRQDVPAEDLFIGFLGGVLHDIGCAVVDRYQEATRVIRHAEAGALVMEHLFSENDYGLNRSEQLLVQYAIAAHTHYQKPAPVQCSDGIEREVRPFVDTANNDAPILSIWIPRWIDRLDINGPTFVGRHYLTQVVDHDDFDGGNYYAVTFASHMRPLLRPRDEIKASDVPQTMREHLAMFANSQNEDSPFGKFDALSPVMVQLRDAQTARLRRIIDVIVPEQQLNVAEMLTVIKAWPKFLKENVEPSPVGEQAANTLGQSFQQLPELTQMAWLNGFAQTMREYVGYWSSIRDDLMGLDKNLLHFPPIDADIREMLRPAFLD